MLILARVFCLLLVATASSALGPVSLRQAKKAFDKAIISSLTKIDEYFEETATCVTTEKRNLHSKIEDLVPGLLAYLNGLEFSKDDRIVSFAVNYPNLRASKVLGPRSIKNLNENHIKLVDKEIDRLNVVTKEETRPFDASPFAAYHCVSIHPNTFFGKLKAASCINKLRRTLRDNVKSAKLHITSICENVKEIAKSGLNLLKIDVRTDY